MKPSIKNHKIVVADFNISVDEDDFALLLEPKKGTSAKREWELFVEDAADLKMWTRGLRRHQRKFGKE